MPASSAGVDGAHTHPLPNGVSYDVSNQLLSIFMVFKENFSFFCQLIIWDVVGKNEKLETFKLEGLK